MRGGEDSQPGRTEMDATMFGQKVLERARQLLPIHRPTPTRVPSVASADITTGQLACDTLLAPHAALVRRIRVAYGYPDDQFELHLLAPITALAAWVHALPGHPGGGFEHRGGALEQALTNCLFSLRAADGRSFHGLDSESSSLSSMQRWRLACALGGLFASMPEVLIRIEVVSDDGRLWPATAVPLLHWLESLPATKYHYRWTAVRDEPHWPAIYAASRCIDPGIMSFLVGGDARVAAALLGSIAGSDRPTHDPISEVVNMIAVAVAARDAPAESFRPADLITTTLERLLGTSDWLPNSPGGHVWFASDGMYLLWPDAAAKLIEAIPRSMRGPAGFASHDDVLRQIVALGIVDASPSPLFRIAPPRHGKPQAAVRIAEPYRAQRGLGRHVAPLASRLGVPAFSEPAPGKGASNDTALVDAASNAGFLPAFDTESEVADAQQPGDDCDELRKPLDESLRDPAARSALTMDTSKITNPRSRELVDGVVQRLEESFDKMLSTIVAGGVFVALKEFVGQHGDGSAIVRALHDAQLLAVDATATRRRVVQQKIEGADVVGVVLASEAFQGYIAWVDRWRDDALNGTPP